MFVVYKLSMTESLSVDLDHKERVEEFQTLEEARECMEEMNRNDDKHIYTIMME